MSRPVFVDRGTRCGSPSATMSRNHRVGTLFNTLLFFGLVATVFARSCATPAFVEALAWTSHRGQPVRSVAKRVPNVKTTTQMNPRYAWRTKNGRNLSMLDSSNRMSNGRGRKSRWKNFTKPPAGRVHDDITFRSGFEGRTLTIPQGVCVCVCLHTPEPTDTSMRSDSALA